MGFLKNGKTNLCKSALAVYLGKPAGSRPVTCRLASPRARALSRYQLAVSTASSMMRNSYAEKLDPPSD
jgi:hypothetical protein